MHVLRKKKIVLLGMMSRMPVAGVVLQNMHYLAGFQRLGYDVYYVEDHACSPSMFQETEEDDGSAKAAKFIADVMQRLDLNDRWAYHALHGNGACYGLGDSQLRELYSSADLIINLHGGTMPLPEHYATGRLVFLETDPVELQLELYEKVQQAIDYLEPHCAFFTFAENYGKPDCRLPLSDRFRFLPTRQPVVFDFWDHLGEPRGVSPRVTTSAPDTWTTIGNWRQNNRDVRFQGETYFWSKHHEFLKLIDLPRRTGEVFELALSGYEPEDKQLLGSHGWKVRHALDFSMDVSAYQSYIQGSRGEFTVAKDQNIRLRTGWFSDRSATYLASGRPVITQETGFSAVYPTGEGLFAFTNMEDVVAALEAVRRDYDGHCRSARALARDYFSYEVVLKRLLADVGM